METWRYSVFLGMILQLYGRPVRQKPARGKIPDRSGETARAEPRVGEPDRPKNKRAPAAARIPSCGKSFI